MSCADYAFNYVHGRIGPREYLYCVLEHLGLIGEFKSHASTWTWVRSVIETAFWVLDSQPRDLPFWENTNRLATFNKLAPFAHFRIGHDIDLEFSSETAIACGFVNSAPEMLHPTFWKHLLSASEHHADLLVSLAYLDSQNWEHANIEPTADLARVLDASGCVTRSLRRLSEMGSDEAEWAAKVASRLGAEWPSNDLV